MKNACDNDSTRGSPNAGGLARTKGAKALQSRLRWIGKSGGSMLALATMLALRIADEVRAQQAPATDGPPDANAPLTLAAGSQNVRPGGDVTTPPNGPDAGVTAAEAVKEPEGTGSTERVEGNRAGSRIGSSGAPNEPQAGFNFFDPAPRIVPESFFSAIPPVYPEQGVTDNLDDGQSGGEAQALPEPPVEIEEPANTAPVIASLPTSEVLTETDDALTATGQLTFSDADAGDEPKASLGDQTVTTTGATLTDDQIAAIKAGLVVASDGTWTFNLASPDYLPAGAKIVLVSTVTVSDGKGGTVSQDVTITIDGTNDKPVIASLPTSEVLTETDDALTASGRLTFSDADAGDQPAASLGAQTVTTTGATLTDDQIAAIKAGLVVASDGTWAFNLASPDYLPADAKIVLVSTVTVSDGKGGTVSQDVTITIDGTNDAPVIASSAASAVLTESDAVLTTAGKLAFGDVDAGDQPAASLGAQTVTATGATLTDAQIAAIKAGLVVSADGTWAFNLASPDYLPKDAKIVLVSTVTVSDGKGGEVSQDVTITIDGTNDKPVIASSAASAVLIESDAVLTTAGKLAFGDVDAGDQPAASLGAQTVTATGATLTDAQIAAIKAGLVVSENGTWTFNLASPDYLPAGAKIVLCPGDGVRRQGRRGLPGRHDHHRWHER